MSISVISKKIQPIRDCLLESRLSFVDEGFHYSSVPLSDKFPLKYSPRLLFVASFKASFHPGGWEIAQAIEAHTKCGVGYCGLTNSLDPNSKVDKQDSYFLAETLKYLYLIFMDDELMPLVMNGFQQ